MTQSCNKDATIFQPAHRSTGDGLLLRFSLPGEMSRGLYRVLSQDVAPFWWINMEVSHITWHIVQEYYCNFCQIDFGFGNGSYQFWKLVRYYVNISSTSGGPGYRVVDGLKFKRSCVWKRQSFHFCVTWDPFWTLELHSLTSVYTSFALRGQQISSVFGSYVLPSLEGPDSDRAWER